MSATRTRPKPSPSANKSAAARAEAERLLSVPEEQPSLPLQKPPEPTLAERMANIDRRARERAEEEKRLLALDYLKDKEASFEKMVNESPSISEAWKELKNLKRLAGGPVGIPSVATSDGSHGRLTSSFLAPIADKIVGMLKGGEEVNVQQMVAEIGHTTEIIRAAVGKLKREGKIKSNGQRGLNGAWVLT